MRWWHFSWRRWNPILPVPAPTALYALTGIDTRLNVRCPSQLGRVVAMVASGQRVCYVAARTVAPAPVRTQLIIHEARRRACSWDESSTGSASGPKEPASCRRGRQEYRSFRLLHEGMVNPGRQLTRVGPTGR